ncbi:glycosyltransferase 87 family protein [Jatrophihabitans endophyticus]|uniref:glycosyltransferase 87 family protein n=1 Tax=Jatrophihabitans endophyticus TaxID=1206085 RepID=UPI0019DA7C27|nr:glycosyltransferase 87 family protein [Jatrophihabitans endophyticus]MBE7187704.1 DUF2029 domain-containing protein [Jatrophihabitans endophyticus]
MTSLRTSADKADKADQADMAARPVIDHSSDDAVAGARAARRPALPLEPVVVLLAGLGLVVEAWSVGRSRAGDVGAATQVLFWIGMLAIFVPAAARILARSTGMGERVRVSVLLTLALQFSRTVLYPMFAMHDELIHANEVRLIESTQHLFAANSLLPVVSYYPGMEVVTDGLHELTGLSVHASAVVLLLLVHVVSTLALIGIVSTLTGSTRSACIAGLVYTCNPQSVFFNGQFSYQSVALPLAFFVVYAFVSRDRTSHWWRALAIPAAALLAVILTHHLTSMLLVLFLGAWVLVDAFVIRRREHDDVPGLTALFVGGYVAIIAWGAQPGNPVYGYLKSIGQSSVSDVKARIAGQQTHHLFQSSGGIVSPLWERAATIAAILIVLVAVVPVIWLLRRWVRGSEALLVLVGVIAALYPIIPLGHVTPGTAEVTDRASGFLFLGVGVVVALGPAFTRAARSRLLVPALTALTAIVFVGGEVLGAGATVAQLPGPYLVSADARSIDGPNLAAARWERAHLPAGTRVYADRDSGLLAASIGRMNVVTHVADGIDASGVLLAPTFTAADRRLIRQADIQYVVVDQRDSTDLPNQQVYVESGEYGSSDRTRPVSSKALHKLAHVPGVTRVYSNGPLVIYDVRTFDAH